MKPAENPYSNLPALPRLAAAQTRVWNCTIPRRALQTVIGETHTTYLHPTKGYRRVSNRRLGFEQ